MVYSITLKRTEAQGVEMEKSQLGSLSIDSTVTVTGAGRVWRGEVMPPGVVVRGQSREEVLRLASEATDAMVQSIFQGPNPLDTLKAYLDALGVEHAIDVADVANVATPTHRPYAEQLAVSREYELA